MVFFTGGFDASGRRWERTTYLVRPQTNVDDDYWVETVYNGFGQKASETTHDYADVTGDGVPEAASRTTAYEYNDPRGNLTKVTLTLFANSHRFRYRTHCRRRQAERQVILPSVYKYFEPIALGKSFTGFENRLGGNVHGSSNLPLSAF